MITKKPFQPLDGVPDQALALDREPDSRRDYYEAKAEITYVPISPQERVNLFLAAAQQLAVTYGVTFERAGVFNPPSADYWCVEAK